MNRRSFLKRIAAGSALAGIFKAIKMKAEGVKYHSVSNDFKGLGFSATRLYQTHRKRIFVNPLQEVQMDILLIEAGLK